MKYENIRKARISHKDIAKALGYSDVKSFRSSTAHQRIMKGVDGLIGIAVNRVLQLKD